MLPLLAAMSGGQKGGKQGSDSESNSRSQDASQQTSEQQKQIDALKSQLADTGRAAQRSPKADSGSSGLEEQITDAQIEMSQEQIKRLREENDLAARQNRVVVEKTSHKTGDVVESRDTIASQKRSIRGLGGASSASQPVSKLLSSI